ncbi:hypothetical protein STVIR_8798 [Streptomyces viridochromogenes Tue57]|uniref:Transposase DDE domain-containing protein n=1 Tax=Streptomyces viridochromogenes Tue57 TaxID=1160705 RepID=L8P293_STRVR|nr:hypothetical protein STVIR_8798 [Streptomyces viridochromogenes Tue57]
MVSHTGSRLLADLADATGLTGAFTDALRRLRPRGTGHDPGRIAVDLAVMLADGGEAIADLALLRDQVEVFGPVASTPTAWRLLAGIDQAALAALRAARATDREAAWLQAAETRTGIPAARAGGCDLPGLVLDIDATLVTCHSEKEQAAATYKRGFGYHPLLCFLDNTGEALAGVLRPGNAGANTAADHIALLDAALAQIPDAHRHGTGILIRADSAGGAKAFLAHVRALRERGIHTSFSVGHAVTELVRRAIRALPDHLWHPALEQDGTLRTGAEVAELTGMVDLADHPPGTRVIVRRERPHPGAQLSLFDLDEGMRHREWGPQVWQARRPGPFCLGLLRKAARAAPPENPPCRASRWPPVSAPTSFISSRAMKQTASCCCCPMPEASNAGPPQTRPPTRSCVSGMSPSPAPAAWPPSPCPTRRAASWPGC